MNDEKAERPAGEENKGHTREEKKRKDVVVEANMVEVLVVVV